MKLSEARILITGGGRGIGHYVATNILGKVSGVIIIDQDLKLLEEIPDSENLLKFQADITNATEVEKLVKVIFDKHGGINVCINNAGIIHSEPLVNILNRPDSKHSIPSWQKVMDVNLNAVFYVGSNVAERLILQRHGGVIINISSISAMGNAGQSAYSASKAAVEALTKTWSKELGMFKIRCACIAPGFFNTPSTKESLSENMLAKWQKNIPLGRLGELNEILHAVEFIITNDYYNGKILALDGGLTI
jgi:3-oxoacyl-[acyl-carrier protein] reductase